LGLPAELLELADEGTVKNLGTDLYAEAREQLGFLRKAGDDV
jgi:hypothetical protein